MIHELKTVDPFFTDVWDGRKTFEIRKLDRPFMVGHTLRLRWYEATAEDSPGFYLDRTIIVQVKHILTWDDFEAGIRPGYGVLSVEVLRRLQGFEEIRSDP